MYSHTYRYLVKEELIDNVNGCDDAILSAPTGIEEGSKGGGRNGRERERGRETERERQGPLA